MIRRLFVAFSAALLVSGCSGERPHNLVLVVVDTLRADHLPFYGYDRDTSPHLARLAGEAVIFEHCLSPIPLTDPAMSSLLSGAYPFQHGVRDTGYTMAGQVPTLAEALSSQGYSTCALFSRAGLASVTGLGRGFQVADDRTVGPGEAGPHPWHTREGAEMWQRRANEITDLALEWLDGQGDEPFFLLLHYFDPHAYYDPPDAFRNRFPPRATTLDDPELRSWWGPVDSLGSEISRYDEEILTVDHHLDRVLQGILEKGLWDRTLFVLTSDHGESLGEHGVMDHGEWLYEEQLHVPLMIRDPGTPQAAGQRIGQMVRLIDIPATVLELLRVSDAEFHPFDGPGRSLAPLLRGEALAVEPVLLETENCPADDGNVRVIGMECSPPGILGKRRGVHDGRWKLVVTPGEHDHRVELFDLRTDPGERHDRSAQEPEIVARLWATLESSLGPGVEGMVNEQLVEQLRALGYAE